MYQLHSSSNDSCNISAFIVVRINLRNSRVIKFPTLSATNRYHSLHANYPMGRPHDKTPILPASQLRFHLHLQPSSGGNQPRLTLNMRQFCHSRHINNHYVGRRNKFLQVDLEELAHRIDWSNHRNYINAMLNFFLRPCNLVSAESTELTICEEEHSTICT